jgi:hypothetical protein
MQKARSVPLHQCLLLQFLLLIPLHLLLDPHPLRNNFLPSARDPPPFQILRTNLFDCLQLHQAIFALVASIKIEWRTQRDWWISNDPRHALAIPSSRVHHQRMQKYDVADLAGHLVEFGTRLDQAGKEAQSLLSRRWLNRNHRRRHSGRVIIL